MLVTLRMGSVMALPFLPRRGEVAEGGGVMRDRLLMTPPPCGHLPRAGEDEGARSPSAPRYARMTSGWAWTSAGVPMAIGRP